MKRRITWLTSVALILVIVTIVYAAETNIYKQIKLVGEVIKTVYRDYVDTIDYRKLVKGAIDGMTATLDPHTVFFTKQQYEELRVDTRGSFGGLGIQIGMREKWLTVIAPIEGTPAYRAGIQAGDKIIKIEGKTTRGITTEKAVQQLRGEPGTKVTITIERESELKPFDVTIVRDIIEIKPVPYYGLTDEGIGYIRLVTFSSDAGNAIGLALADLTNQGAKGIILDLRSNPGGLLSQAVEVASHFLGREALVVYTKGRSTYQSREYYTEDIGEYPEGPLVILVDGGSASASEIVAGAIQDHDRGLILGRNTFGKGLVQSVKPMPGGTALKITTAKYYIPSGRCIQNESYLNSIYSSVISDTIEWNPEEMDPWDFETEPADTDTTEAEKPLFYTTSGRFVYGGGGIAPDIDSNPRKLNKLEIELYRKGLFFGFAIHYIAEHKRELKSPDFEITTQMVQEFREFMTDKEFEYETRAEVILNQIDSIAVDDNLSEASLAGLETLHSQLKLERESEFERSIDLIRREIRRQLINSLWGEKERYRLVDIKTDETIQRAIEIIANPDEYAGYFEVKTKEHGSLEETEDE